MSQTDSLLVTDISNDVWSIENLVQSLCGHFITKCFRENSLFKALENLFSVSGRGKEVCFEASTFPTWAQMVFLKLSTTYTQCYVFLSALLPSTHTAKGQSQAARPPMPTPPPQAYFPSFPTTAFLQITLRDTTSYHPKLPFNYFLSGYLPQQLLGFWKWWILS